MANISHFTQTVDGVSTTYDIHDAGAVHLGGTNALAGSIVPDTDNSVDLGSASNRFRNIYGIIKTGKITHRVDDDFQQIYGGTNNTNGGSICLYGKDYAGATAGAVRMHPLKGSSESDWKDMYLYPSGTWTWDGTACQITSDQRLKQQITEIDDKLLDAWEDVDLVQFKYNDAVDQKGDNARLHTGYVVQQIDSACKSHNVDISEYGLYCHEEYPQETEEVEVEKEDGTKVKETKVIREASEHYSLRYTEVYAVECMYLRRCIKQLTARIEELEKANKAK